MRLDIFRYSLPLTNLAAQTEFRQPEKDCSGSSKDDALLVYKRPHKSNETLPARVTIPNHRSAHQLGTGCWYYRTVLQSPMTEFRQPLQVQSHLEVPRILVQLGHIQRT